MRARSREPLGRADLWLRDIEAVEAPLSPLVPGPLDMGDLPRPRSFRYPDVLGRTLRAW